MFNANDIESWACEFADAPDVKHLVSLIEADRKLPQPSTLTPGSPERLLAQARQARLSQIATQLGYKPPIKELAVTLTAEVVKSATLGATGISETPIGETLDKMPVPEKAALAEREEDKAKKRRKGISIERTL